MNWEILHIYEFFMWNQIAIYNNEVFQKLHIHIAFFTACNCLGGETLRTGLIFQHAWAVHDFAHLFRQQTTTNHKEQYYYVPIYCGDFQAFFFFSRLS